MPFHAAINIQNLTAIFLHFITAINSPAVSNYEDSCQAEAHTNVGKESAGEILMQEYVSREEEMEVKVIYPSKDGEEEEKLKEEVREIMVGLVLEQLRHKGVVK